MSIPAGIDGNAPVRARHETDINAPLDTVWRLHTDVNAWPAWQTEITSAHINGAFQPGTSFEWTSYGFPVVSTIYAVAERARVLWGGTAGGITGVHEWVFTETPMGVHVITEESFAGEPVEADVTGMQSTLDSSLISWLAHLKAAAESGG
jgi:Polyketide cyclase / dehydrase and lipid transport